MQNAYLGSIFMWAGPRIPQGWKLCNGELLNISDNDALFVVIGTTYGGDGAVTFALPNLTGRFAMGAQALGQIGQFGGSVTAMATTTASLTADNLPEHDHSATVSLTGLSATTTIKADTATTGGLSLASELAVLTSTSAGPAGAAIYLPATVTPTTPVKLGGITTTVAPVVTVANNSTSNTSISVNTPFPTTPPALTMNYIICISGLFPSRN